MKRLTLGLTALQALNAFPACAGQRMAATADQRYRKTIERTAAMVGDPAAQKLAGSHGLQVLNLTWEDTGRYKGSAVGPNISDMTIQVQHRDPGTDRYAPTLMPVIRYPNFEDKSADLAPEKFFLLVGNEKGKKLRRITLRDFLEDPRRFLTRPDSWKGKGKTLLAARDSKVLVSAQACFLPAPKRGVAEFNPVVFNYQSYEGDPAVLTLLATREGTSVTVIDNVRDGFQAGAAWGQRLFFNKKGDRASFTGQRLSDFKEAGGNGKGDGVSAGGQEGLNMVLLIQIPLKQRASRYYGMLEMAPMAGSAALEKARSGSDVEAAVIGHGKVEGPFTELAGLEIERDERFPVRVTVQFYKATSNGVVSEKDMEDIAGQIARVYAQADYVGSLVTAGPTGRVTEHDDPKDEPLDWWRAFWRHRRRSSEPITRKIP